MFSHTAVGTPFALMVTSRADGFVDVAVEDAGDGIAQSRMADRGVSSAGSTGIGLDVARRTAEGGSGALRIEQSAMGGARVVMRFRRPFTTLNGALLHH